MNQTTKQDWNFNGPKNEHEWSHKILKAPNIVTNELVEAHIHKITTPIGQFRALKNANGECTLTYPHLSLDITDVVKPELKMEYRSMNVVSIEEGKLKAFQIMHQFMRAFFEAYFEVGKI